MDLLTPEEVACLKPDDLVEYEREVLLPHRIVQAREDPMAFGEFVLRDSKTKKPIKQHRHHRRWSKLIAEQDRLVLFSHIDSGKSSSVTIGRTLFELGKNPEMRGAIVGGNEIKAGEYLGVIAQYIKESAELKMVFPHLRPSRRDGDPWKPNTAITVERQMGSKDPSIKAIGVGTGSAVGGEWDWLAMDDWLKSENVRTPGERDAVWDWYTKTVAGRLRAGARAVSVGVAHHPEDGQHRLLHHGWVGYRFPVIHPDGTLNWPEHWPLARIEKMKIELGPAEAARQLFCKARDDSAARFKEASIAACLRRGEGVPLVARIEDIPADQRPVGSVAVTGVDLGVSRKSRSDLSALVTTLMLPNGDRRLLEITAGRMSGREIINAVLSAHHRFDSVISIENVAAQDYLVQFARELLRDIRSFTTGRNKRDPAYGLESIATEMDDARWIIPNHHGRMDKEVELLVEEMLDYSQESHTGDRLAACWIGRECGRQLQRRSHKGSLSVRVV